MAIKASDTRKILKSGTVDVTLFRYDWSSDTFHVRVRVKIPDRFRPSELKTYVEFEAQARDVWAPNRHNDNDEEYGQGIKRLPGITYFYALRAESRHHLSPTFSERENDPEQVDSVLALIRATIEKYNLAHVHPNCELSQVVAALHELGCAEGEWDYSRPGRRMDLTEWKQEREKQRPEVAAKEEVES